MLAYENFVSVLGSEDRENGSHFHVMSYYRNSAFVNRECLYSVTACKEEYLAKYLEWQIQEIWVEAHIIA